MKNIKEWFSDRGKKLVLFSFVSVLCIVAIVFAISGRMKNIMQEKQEERSSIYADGFDAGYEAALEDGEEDLYDSGYEDGRNDGYDIGYEEGHASGFYSGYSVGYSDAEAENEFQEDQWQAYDTDDHRNVYEETEYQTGVVLIPGQNSMERMMSLHPELNIEEITDSPEEKSKRDAYYESLAEVRSIRASKTEGSTDTFFSKIDDDTKTTIFTTLIFLIAIVVSFSVWTRHTKKINDKNRINTVNKNTTEKTAATKAAMQAYLHDFEYHYFSDHLSSSDTLLPIFRDVWTLIDSAEEEDLIIAMRKNKTTVESATLNYIHNFAIRSIKPKDAMSYMTADEEDPAYTLCKYVNDLKLSKGYISHQQHDASDLQATKASLIPPLGQW